MDHARRGRVGNKIAHTVTPGNNQGYFFIDLNENPTLTEKARCLLANQDTGIGKFKGGRSGVFVEDSKAPFAVPVRDADGNLHYGKVRKLMPIECWRLQGFSDEQFYKATDTGLSDAQLYKMASSQVPKLNSVYPLTACHFAGPDELAGRSESRPASGGRALPE